MAVAADSELGLEPSLEEARRLAEQGNVVPIRARFVDDCETPVSAFLKLRAGEPEGAPCFLLESAEQGQVGRYSFVGFRPRSVLRWSDGVLSESGGASREAPDPYAAVAEYLAAFEPAPVEGLPPFFGGAVGFFGYDLVRTVEPLGEPNPDPLGLPDMALMVTDVMLVFDHLRHELTILACAFADDEGGIDAAYERAAGDDRRRARPPARRRPRAGAARPSPSRRAFDVQHGAGGVRSHGRPDRRVRPRRRRLPGRPLAALLGARRRSRPSRSTAACAPSTPRPTCTSSSSATSRSPAPRPSRWSRSRAAASRARPIAGTSPRGRSEEEDRRLAERLINDPKERAEHVMLVDLGRNDLGRVCEYGIDRASTS